jgi:methylated-DNA-protein-cysteine methyltransferase related protein
MAITKAQTGKLSAQVYALVRACPKGRVTTYGWLAGAIGYPRGARVVGWIMSATPAGLDIPAQRVISKEGVLTGAAAFGAQDRMRSLLEEDGVTFEEDGHVDMKRYGWDPRLDLNPDELQEVLDGAQSLRVEPPDELVRLLNDDQASPFKKSDPL